MKWLAVISDTVNEATTYHTTAQLLYLFLVDDTSEVRLLPLSMIIKSNIKRRARMHRGHRAGMIACYSYSSESIMRKIEDENSVWVQYGPS